MNAPALLPTEAIAAQIRRIAEYAQAHDPQRLFIRCELRTALDSIERPEASRVLSLPPDRRAEHIGRRAT